MERRGAQALGDERGRPIGFELAVQREPAARVSFAMLAVQDVLLDFGGESISVARCTVSAFRACERHVPVAVKGAGGVSRGYSASKASTHSDAAHGQR